MYKIMFLVSMLVSCTCDVDIEFDHRTCNHEKIEPFVKDCMQMMHKANRRDHMHCMSEAKKLFLPS